MYAALLELVRLLHLTQEPHTLIYHKGQFYVIPSELAQHLAEVTRILKTALPEKEEVT